MTTTPERRLPAGHYGFRNVAAMEWIKLRSLRSMTWVLAGGMAATIAIGVTAGFNTQNAAGDPTSNFMSGIVLGQIVMGVLGVLLMTSEYSSGMIRGNSLSAVKPVQGFTWSPWAELVIVALYAVVLLGAGCWLLVQRDA